MEAAQLVGVRRRVDLVQAAAWVGAAGALLLLFLASGLVLARSPLPLPAVLVFGVGLLGTLALAVARYDAAVALGILLLAVVRVEPAPSDLVFAVVMAVAFASAQLHLERVPLSVTLLVAAFMALNLLASVGAVDAGRAATYFGITFYLGLLGLWLAAYVCSVRRARLVVVAYVTAAALSAAVACLALVTSFPGAEAFVRGPRAQGLFKDPNVFGPFLVPAALILMEETVAPRLFRLRAAAKLVLVSVLTIGVVFSFSRAAWLNLAVGTVVLLAVLALRRGGGRRAMSLLAASLVAGAALFAAVAATSSVDFLSQRAGVQAYDTQRFSAQASSLELATEHPLGIGPGQFERVSDVSAHSTYMRALAEEGLPGLLVVLALLLLTLGFAARNVALGADTYGIGSAALLAAWCGLLANSSFVDTLHWRHLWFVAALIWAGTALRAGYPGR
ncbi:MAG TPA: O-antigen ligase family protein [Gaiellaceae bacterium]|nr:O-antigen ligase family protein [Gaiellaceae bacterium]